MARPYRGPVPGFKGFSLEKEIQSDFSRASNTDIIPRIDTTALPPPIEGSVGWDVVTRRHYYANGTAWVPTGSGGAVPTIYNADDTLAGNRIVTGGANNLSFTGLGAFSVASDTTSLTSTTSLTLDGGPTLNLDGTSLVLPSVPPTDNTNTDILTRDSVTGAIEIRSVASIAGSSVYDSIIPDDYPLLSQAIAAGDTHIFIRNGTYVEPAPVAIPPNSTIDGESRTNVNIQVAGGDGLTITGTKRVSGGTITLTNGSATVAGAGTTFTAFSPGDAIVVLNMVVYVASVTNNTSLTLTDVYQGVTSAGNRYEAYLPSSLSLKNLNVTAPAGTGIVIDSILSPILTNVTSYDCGTNGISVVDCPYYYADIVVTFGNAAIGHSVADLLSLARLNNCFSNNNATRGFSFDFGTVGSDSDGDITLSNCSATCNAIGIFSQRISNIKMSNCNASFNLTEGIRVQEESSRVIVDGCSMSNNGVSGLHLQNITGASGIQKHSINGCIFTDNVTNGINMISCSRLTISTNTIQDSQYGIQSIDNGTGLNRGHCIAANVFRGLSVCAITYTEPVVISIVGNIGMNNVANFVNFSGAAAYDARCAIVGNSLQISGAAAVSLTNTNQISMGQNEFNLVNTATDGFLLVNSDFCRILGNSVETGNGGTTGVSIDANCTGTIVFGNYISSTTNGLVDAGAATLSSGAVWNN